MVSLGAEKWLTKNQRVPRAAVIDMSDGRILLLSFPSVYGDSAFRTRQVAQAFQDAGHAAEIFEIPTTGETGLADRLQAALQQKTRFILSLDNGWAPSIRGRPYSDIAQAPHLIWMQKHPGLQAKAIWNTRGCTGALVTDQEQARYLNINFGKLSGLREVRVLPMPASELPVRDKDIDLLFVGSAPAVRELKLVNTDALTEKKAHAVLELYEQGLPLCDAALQVCQKREGEPLGVAEIAIFNHAAHLALIVRSRWRWQMLQAISKAKLPLTIAGLGWKKIAYRFKPAKLIETSDPDELADLLARARVILACDGMRSAGLNDRILSAAWAGAAVVCAQPDCPDPLPVAAATADRPVATLAKTFLEDEAARQRAVEDLRAAISAKLLWRHGIEEILSLADSLKATYEVV
ncbi:MAG: hypothetical protein ACFB22_11405 [Rhodothalassiaceae bacterium]